MIERLERFRQRSHDADVQALNDARLCRVVRRQQQAAETETSGSDRDRQHTSNAVDRAIERQFTKDDRVVDGATRQRAGGGEQPERNGKVEG